MKIQIAVPCYKRPERLRVFLKSVDKFCQSINGASIYMQPEGVMRGVSFDEINIALNIAEGRQLTPGLARNEAIKNAVKFMPDIIWLTDDDITCTAETDIARAAILASKPGVGCVSLTRKMRENQIAGNEEVKTKIPYVGNGVLFKPEIFGKVQFSNDGSDEIDFTGRVYLEGYENYRVNYALVIHDQGRGSGGGLRRMYKDFYGGDDIMINDKTKYSEASEYIEVTLAKQKYGQCEAPHLVGDKKKITAKGEALHTENRKKMGIE